MLKLSRNWNECKPLMQVYFGPIGKGLIDYAQTSLSEIQSKGDGGGRHILYVFSILRIALDGGQHLRDSVGPHSEVYLM
jgi:hypothetical protein